MVMVISLAALTQQAPTNKESLSGSSCSYNPSTVTVTKYWIPVEGTVRFISYLLYYCYFYFVLEHSWKCDKEMNLLLI